jgi:hypothetical protein
MRDLHWLPLEQRIIYKLCSLMHLINTGHSPKYLQELVTLTPDIASRLRSASSRRYETPSTRLKFGKQCFSFTVRNIQHGILWPFLFKISAIIARLNVTLKLNFLTVYTRRNIVLFVMRYWSRTV